MPILHVRNVPEDLYQLIRRQAREQKRSISAQVIYLLDRAVQTSPENQARLLENIRQKRTYQPKRDGAPNSLHLLREDRER